MTKNSGRGSGAVSGRRPPAPDRPPHSPPPAEATGDAKPLVLAAEAAVLRSIVDPEQALHAGRTVLSAAESCGDVEAAVVALRAMALGARELGDLQAAERHLRRAIATPQAPRERLAQARLSLVTVRTERGHPLQALRIAALAWAYLSPLDRAKLDTQRAVALAHLGRYQEAIASCDRALQALVAAPGTIDDRRFLAGGLLNRGLVHAYRGDWESAARDITACLQIARHAGLDHLVRLASANLPFLAVRRGDLAGAFGHYRAAEDTLFGYPERLATMRADFAGALLAAHLPGEARELLTMAVPDLEASGALVALAEARLKLAQVELLTGDARRALTVAARAELELAAQDREAWLPLVREVTLRARLMLEGPTPRLLGDLVDCADELETGSALAVGAGALRLVAAETALALDDHPLARDQLAHLTAHAIPDAPRVPEGTRLITLSSEAQAGHLARASQIPAPVRRHALALEASLREDVPGALREVRVGLAEVGSQMDAFDDPALRAHAARAGERLAAFGLSLAVRDGSPAEVFGWAERWRAVAAPAHPGGTADPDQVRAALDSGALVEFVVEGRSLLAVVITGERMALRRLGDLGPITEALIQLRYALRRSSLGDCGTGGGLVGPAAEELERLLFGPIEAELGDRPMVVVPAGVLHTLPWGALPCLRERPVSVAAGATAWLAARRRGPVPSWPPLVAAAAGPGLAHAGAEVGRVLALHPRGRQVAGRTGAVLDALVTADVLHLAAHGVFHARSPLLSAITLEDGPLMAYDLLGLARTARLVVLSACDSGMARTPAEGAPLGLAGTFLARGTTCVVAGMVPVRDEDALAVMTLFHELLATGCPPASALASAAAKTGVLGFACFGAGDQPVATGLPGSATQLDHEPT
ncbi:CHAT domain-containing protein [Nonomuraea cavernae]|uniref:CHAT domain-containing protein n=1 Tax=Nonomuraea cavernae TaxID=2045107 RepID=A0A917ZE38_9ACTN|nr:CHAT domain-containing tetratricopeptide repeat protein [Nonomuraea cavernae]MCA2187529.1 CHAT domain-containing tetratricopeptide repeat protein [Nonomuraea cavernae]GGO80154.1 CHAT domain-containing protein [Nonomuraea cavernae]